jgi:selenocysteine-specific elongation factor
MKHFVIATAGHVDHGKSALVKALTGTDPDRLPQEKARGITIELGFAELSLRGPNSEEIHAGIVDVPGHEDFVRNMIAGVGSIDLALLVVAADDGWMPQTEEHLQVLEYLGINRAVIALTKIDIGNPDKVENQIREKLCGTAFASAPLVRTSLRSANLFGLTEQVCVGISELKILLASELSHMHPQRDIGKPRLFVDRAFSLRGVGTVVTGTLTGGTLRLGDSVVVQPRGTRTRIRSLQSHGRDVDLANPGTRVAVNLPDLALGEDIARGDAVTSRGFEPTKTMDVLLERSTRAKQLPPLKSRTSLYFHHGAKRQHAKIILLDSESLAAGSRALARIELSEPALVFIGDRFVVRDASEQHTLGGGSVLDLYSMAAAPLDRNRVAPLSARANSGRDVDVYARTEIARSGATISSDLLMQSRFSGQEITESLQRLRCRDEIFLHGNVVADSATWRSLRERATGLIDADHRNHPDHAGLDLDRLRSAFASYSPEIVDALIVDLCRSDFVRAGAIVRRSSHRAALPDEIQTIADEICARLSEKPFDPPSRQQLVANDRAQQALRFLLEEKEVIQISDDLVLSRVAFENIKNAIAVFISRNGAATVSQLRQALGSSRRVMVPLLERLDRDGFTRRIGDERTLAQQITSAKLSDAASTRRS